MTNGQRPPRIPTPCNHDCGLGSNGVCGGCFRTYEEIVNWTKLSDIERQSVMAVLACRRSAATRSGGNDDRQ